MAKKKNGDELPTVIIMDDNNDFKTPVQDVENEQVETAKNKPLEKKSFKGFAKTQNKATTNVWRAVEILDSLGVVVLSFFIVTGFFSIKKARYQVKNVPIVYNNIISKPLTKNELVKNSNHNLLLSGSISQAITSKFMIQNHKKFNKNQNCRFIIRPWLTKPESFKELKLNFPKTFIEKNVSRLQALLIKDKAPVIDVEKPIPSELLTNQFDEIFLNYTIKALVEEFTILFNDYKQPFYATNSPEAIVLYDTAQKVFDDMVKKLEREPFYNHKNIENFFNFEADSIAFHNFRSELNFLNKNLPKNRDLAFKKQRELIIKYQKDLLPLRIGLIGVDNDGKTIMSDEQKKRFNRLAAKISLQEKLALLEMVNHHIIPRFTSTHLKNNEINHRGLDIPKRLIRAEANQVTQFTFLNQILEEYMNFCLKRMPNLSLLKSNYNLGIRVFSYVARTNININVAAKNTVKLQPYKIIFCEWNSLTRDYFKQEASMERHLQTTFEITEVINTAKLEDLPNIISNTDLKKFESNKEVYKVSLFQRDAFIVKQRSKYQLASRFMSYVALLIYVYITGNTI